MVIHYTSIEFLNSKLCTYWAKRDVYFEVVILISSYDLI